MRDIINGVCCQRYKKRREQQQKDCLNVNVCAAEENFEEELSLNQYFIIVSIQISTVICYCWKHKLSGFLLYKYGYFWCATWVYLKSLNGSS